MEKGEEVTFISETVKNVELAIKAMRNDLDEHLEDINANTNEILANYEFLCRLEEKIEKLNERIDGLELSLKKEPARARENMPPLTPREQQVFLVLYEAGENFLSYLEIGRKLGLSEAIVSDCITSLIAKGVPVVKRYINKKSYLSIEKGFRELQTKENIVGIKSPVSVQVFG